MTLRAGNSISRVFSSADNLKGMFICTVVAVISVACVLVELGFTAGDGVVLFMRGKRALTLLFLVVPLVIVRDKLTGIWK